MGRQRRVHRPVKHVFPQDFPMRLELFKEASGHSWRSMARTLGVKPKVLRAWRSGVVPGSTHLFCLLTLADGLGFRDILMYGDCDPPEIANPDVIEGRID